MAMILTQTTELDFITRDILEAKEDMVLNTLKIGSRLQCAKDLLKHGEWGNWLKTVDIGERNAQQFIKTYNETSNPNSLTGLNQTQIFSLLAIDKGVREEFINSTYEIRGEEKKVSEMSSRELAKVIKEYNKPVEDIKVEEKIIEDPVTLDNNLSKVEEIIEPIQMVADVPTKQLEHDINDISEEIKQIEYIIKEIKMRTGHIEDKENLVACLLENDVITLEKYARLIEYYGLENLPLCLSKKATLDFIERVDFYSNYEHYDGKNSYLSILNQGLKFEHVGKVWGDSESTIDYVESSFITNNNITIALLSEEYSDYLCVFIDEILEAHYVVEINDIADLLRERKSLVELEEYLDLHDIATNYDELLVKFEDYNRRQEARDKIEDELRKVYARKKEVWKIEFERFCMGIKFEEIYNLDLTFTKEGTKLMKKIKANRTAQNNYNKKSSYDFSSILKPTVKEEEKPLYKQMYRELSRKFHPDVYKGENGTEIMQLVNGLKGDWGV